MSFHQIAFWQEGFAKTGGEAIIFWARVCKARFEARLRVTGASSLQELLFLQPERAVARPRMELCGIVVAAAEAHAVFAVLINVQREGNSGAAQRRRKIHAVLHRHG